MTERLLTPKEVSRELRVAPLTVYRWARGGRLRAVRLPGGQLRVPASELVRLLAGDQLDQLRRHVPAGELGSGRMKLDGTGKLFLVREDGAVATLDGAGATVTSPDGRHVAAYKDGREIYSGPGGQAA